mgnify:CR=1 FL=1
MDNALVVNLNISMWSGHKLDKAKTSEVNHNANADSDASRVNKHLVSKTSMADIVKCSGALRQYVYRATLPWGDNGDRLIGASGYMVFVEEFAKLKQQFDESVRHFIDVLYPAERARAQFRMGDMFVPSDYPEPDYLRHKFAVALDVHGVPAATDLRAQLREEDIQYLRAEIENNNTAKLRTAMQTLWQRLFDTVSHFADRMQEDEKFKDATVRNLHRLMDEVPALNISGDPALDELCEELKAKLAGLEAATLRTSPVAREQARKAAASIASKMSGMMAAFN